MEAPGIKVRYIISSTNREALRGLMVKARPGVDFRRRWELHLFLKTHFFRGGGELFENPASASHHGRYEGDYIFFYRESDTGPTIRLHF